MAGQPERVKYEMADLISSEMIPDPVPTVAATASEALAAFFSGEVRADPYPVYAQLREWGPVHPSPLGGSAVVSHAGVAAALHHPKMSSERAGNWLGITLEAAGVRGPFVRSMTQMMPFRDPPDHTRLRSLVSKAFTRRAISDLRPTILRIVDELLAPAAERRSLEVMSELARPVPALTICELLGVPASDRADFQTWSDDVVAACDPIREAGTMDSADEAMESFFGYFQDLVAERTKNPDDGLLSMLIRAEEEGEVLTAEEVISFGILLLVAGYETTMNLLGNSILTLVRHPDLRRRLADDPGRLPSAVDELARFDGAVHAVLRVPLEDVTIDGQLVAEGEQLILLIGSANRDERVFAHADRLDIDRPNNNQSLAFGGGLHFCLGAQLARLEAELTLPALLRLAPEPELAVDDDELRWRPNFSIRSPLELPLRW